MRGRVYPALPRPLKVRYHVHMTDNKSSSIVVEANNSPLDVEDKVNWQKEKKQTAVVWAQCDDTVIEHRIWVAVRLS